jgi:hypothetical protein
VPASTIRIILPDLQDDAKRWFDCATEMRTLASDIIDSDGRALALKVAKDLGWFAEWLALQKERETLTEENCLCNLPKPAGIDRYNNGSPAGEEQDTEISLPRVTQR